MRITVFGAANDVTGSCFLVETDTARILVDCGMFQGSDKLERLNYLPQAVNPYKLDAVVLTHGHLDHCGRLPLLVKNGYRGPIYTTAPTADIARLILMDSAHIQADDAERENRQRAREHRKKIEPLYDEEDADKACQHFQPVDYDKQVEVAPGISATFVEAGHILGSASIELNVTHEGKQTRFVFSGDIGQWDVPILRDPTAINQADVVFMESTYGDRNHRPLADTVAEFHSLIAESVAHKGKILIPTFAVGRAQLMLFYLAEMIRDKIIPAIPIYLDSPMAIAATDVYESFVRFMDAESQRLQTSGQMRHDLETLHPCVSVDESKALNNVEGPCVILAGAGMCNAGRILHHLQHNVSSPNTVVLIVGYQPRGSLGRALVEGAETVKIMGETVRVRAKVRGLGGFSAHGGQAELLKWLAPMAPSKPKIVLIHGESNAMNVLGSKIEQQFHLDVDMPKLGDTLFF